MMTLTIDQAFDAGLLIDEAGRPIVSRKQLADAKWITVHPNGAGSKGTPVQISENGTVLAGMDGTDWRILSADADNVFSICCDAADPPFNSPNFFPLNLPPIPASTVPFSLI